MVWIWIWIWLGRKRGRRPGQRAKLAGGRFCAAANLARTFFLFARCTNLCATAFWPGAGASCSCSCNFLWPGASCSCSCSCNFLWPGAFSHPAGLATGKKALRAQRTFAFCARTQFCTRAPPEKETRPQNCAAASRATLSAVPCILRAISPGSQLCATAPRRTLHSADNSRRGQNGAWAGFFLEKPMHTHPHQSAPGTARLAEDTVAPGG